MPRVAQAPPPGVLRYATPDASAGRWWDCNNIRFRQGQMQPIGGNVTLFPDAVNAQITDLPRDLLTWHDNSLAPVRWAAFGTDSKLYAYRFDLQQLYDITPTGVGPLSQPGARVGYGLANYSESTYGTARDPSDIGPQDIAATMGARWSMDTYGQDLLIVPTQDGHLFRWSPTTPTTKPAIVANAPYPNQGVIVTDQRHVVLLAAGGDPRNIAWSEQEDPTTWTPNVTNLAGSKLLVTTSYAMTAVKVSSGILIFTANDVHLMQYVGAPYAYGISQIAAGCGPMSPRSVVHVGSFVMWPGTQNFWSYNGNVQAWQSEIQDWFFSLVNRNMVGRVFGSPNPAFSELWWDWPGEDAQECNQYVAVNYSDPQRPWTIGKRTRTAGDPIGTMDYPILGGPLGTGGSLYLHEFGWLDNGVKRAENGLVYAESGSIQLGEGDRRYHVVQLVLDAASASVPTEPHLPPLSSDDDPVFGYRFFVREQPHDNIGEIDTGLYTVSHAGLMDMRWSGRVARMRLEALKDEPFAMGRPRLEMRPGGSR